MIQPGTKLCDSCRSVVAVRNKILFHTVKDYVTIRGDDITTYVNMEDRTTPYKLHYCRCCWNRLWEKVDK